MKLKNYSVPAYKSSKRFIKTQKKTNKTIPLLVLPSFST